MVLVQVISGSLAGVYIEKQLKTAPLPLSLQNIFLYFDSIICNMCVLLYNSNGDIYNFLNYNNFKSLLHINVIAIIFISSIIGIVCSVFLKHLDAIVKVTYLCMCIYPLFSHDKFEP